jgi:hypothetical protein
LSDAFIQTFTGKQVNPLDMRPEDIDVKDIAHALSLTNRFTGHTILPYSVAQHSVLVANLCEPENQLWGLLHDAPEAYFADISRPVKKLLNAKTGGLLRFVEDQIMAAICQKFNLDLAEPPNVKWADDKALANEAYSFFGNTPGYSRWHHQFHNGYEQLPYLISPTDCYEAEYDFLSTFKFLQKLGAA